MAPVEISPERSLEGLLGFRHLRNAKNRNLARRSRSMGESIEFDSSKATQLVLAWSRVVQK